MRMGTMAAALVISVGLASCATRQTTAQAQVAAAPEETAHVHSVHRTRKGKSGRHKEPASREVMTAQRQLLAGGPGALDRAAASYRRAAMRGNATAQYDLAFCLESGLGVQADREEAMRWYRKAAVNRGNPAVQKMAALRLSALTQTAKSEPQ